MSTLQKASRTVAVNNGIVRKLMINGKIAITMLSFIIMSFWVIGCTGEDETVYTNTFRVTPSENINLEEAAEIAKNGGAEEFIARIAYSGHDSNITVYDINDLGAVISAEVARLEFLSSQFSQDDPLEAPVYAQFIRDIKGISEGGTLSVRWVQYVGYAVDGSEVIEYTEKETVASDNHNNNVSISKRAMVTDYPQDAWWTPAGGTSTIYTTGTLQKFWLDSASKSIINTAINGLEIDTVIAGSSNATCNTNGVSSNMPGYYADTEALDWFNGGNNRNCSVGTIHADYLQIGTLYWVWHPFSSFNAAANPSITVMYQAKDWCPWVADIYDCALDMPWCMCAIEWPYANPYPTQYLINYNYNDRPGLETSWIKN